MKISPPYTVPGAEPGLLRAGKTACLLLHGFTAQPEEMKFLADDLHGRGYSVLIPAWPDTAPSRATLAGSTGAIGCSRSRTVSTCSPGSPSRWC